MDGTTAFMKLRANSDLEAKPAFIKEACRIIHPFEYMPSFQFTWQNCTVRHSEAHIQVNMSRLARATVFITGQQTF